MDTTATVWRKGHRNIFQSSLDDVTSNDFRLSLRKWNIGQMKKLNSAKRFYNSENDFQADDMVPTLGPSDYLYTRDNSDTDYQ